MRRIFAFLLLLILLGWAGYGVAASYTPPRTFFVATASVTATGSSTSAQSLIGTGISQDGTTSPTLPANFFSVAGSGLDIFASGYYSSGTITTQTATFAVKLGSTTLLASSAVTPISGVTSGAWMMHCKVTAYTVGSSGTLQANCGVTLTGSTLTPADVPLVNTSTVSLNTTTTQAVTTTITWGGSPSSSQTITATNYVLSYIDAPMAYTGGGGSGFTFSQACTGSASTGTTITATCSSPVLLHDLIVANFTSGGSVGTITMADNCGSGNAYLSPPVQPGSAGEYYSYTNSGTGATQTCSTDTITFTGSLINGGVLTVTIFHDGTGTPTIDAAAVGTSNGSSTTYTGASITTTVANDVVILAAGTPNHGTVTFTAGAGYTLPSGGQGGDTVDITQAQEYAIETGTGTFSPTVTLDNAYAGQSATLSFKP